MGAGGPATREAVAAAAIAGILEGSVPSDDQVRDVAGALLAALPEKALKEDPADCAYTAAAIAALVVEEEAGEGVPAVDMARGGGLLARAMKLARLGADATARAREAVYRAVYAVNAVKRVRAAEGVSGTIEAIGRERRNNALQREAAKRRLAADEMTVKAVELWGPTLGWYHLNPTEDPRPHHYRADRCNWRPARGAPKETGSLPGAEPNCGCVAGPPILGARMLS